MDRFSAVAPACVRVLVLPVGQIEKTTFLDTVTQLQSHTTVLPLDGLKSLFEGSDDFLLSPLHSPKASILYNYAVSELPEQQRQLAPFELCRETLLVLGVVAGLSKDAAQQETELKAALNELREKHGRVVHRHLLVLDHTSVPSSLQDTTGLASHSRDGFIAAMQQITVRFLLDFTTYAKAMQASPGIQTPGQASQGLLRSLMLREEENRPRSRQSTAGEPTSPSAEGSSSRPASQDITPATTFDQMPVANTLGRSDSNTSRGSKSRPRATSFDRVPVLSKDKLRDRGKARVGIVTASIYLMAGRWVESLKILVDNSTRLRALNDHLWNAKGLELIVVCILLHLWAGLDVQVPAICYQLSDKVRDRFSKAFAAELAQKISGPQTSAEKLSSSLPDLLRHILLLYHSVEGTMELPYITIAEATVRLSKILACIHCTNGALNEQSIPRIVEQESPSPNARWSSSTFQPQKPLSKVSISDLLTHALPMNDESVSLADYISILTGIASVYDILKMERKKAITLKTLVTRLTTALHQARKLGAAEVGIHPAASLSVDNGTEDLQASSGLTQLAHDVAMVYGVALGSAEISTSTEHTSFGSSALKLEILRDLLRLCEAAPDLKGISLLVVAFMTSAGRYGSLDFRTERLPGSVSVDEQSRLIGMLSKASSLSKQLGMTTIEGHYWDPFLVRGLELQTPPPNQAIYELSSTQATTTAGNPLLYDPNAIRSTVKKQSIVLPMGETAMFSLTLQNAFDVTVDIEHIELVTEGVALQCSHKDIHLGPARLEHILIEVLPQAVGDTTITGCRIKVAGCAEQVFLLTTLPWSSKDSPMVKSLGQDVLHQTAAAHKSMPQHDVVSISVIDSQPQLSINDSDVSWDVMLLEGEERCYTVVLENISDVAATILSITCSTASMWARESERPNSKPSSSKPVTTQLVSIEPRQDLIQDFHLRGTTDDTAAEAIITYAASASSIFTRVCKVHVNVTVKPVVKVQRLDVIDNGNDSITFVLDLSNLWLKPVTYTCYAGITDPKSCTEDVLDAGQSGRVQVKAKRSFVSTTELFDLKQELVKYVHVEWRTVGRHGSVPLDAIELSEAAVTAMRGPAIDVSLTLLNTKSQSTESDEAKAGEFMVVRATIKNRMKPLGPTILSLRFQLPHSSPDTHVAVPIAGSTSRLVPALAADATKHIDFALCPLLSGNITVDAALRPVLPSEAELVGTTTRPLRLEIVG